MPEKQKQAIRKSAAYAGSTTKTSPLLDKDPHLSNPNAYAQRGNVLPHKPKSTRIFIGNDSYKLNKDKEVVPVFWDMDLLANQHVGVAGTSGAGKTHWIRRFIESMPESVSVDIFDYHGDINVEATSVLFSEQTRYGYNPLVLNTDPDYGGVRRGINDVIDAINATSVQLGSKQEAVLRHLLADTYAARGILPDDPRTWRRRCLTLEEAVAYRTSNDAAAIWDSYPGLEDVVRLAKRKLKSMWIGVDDTPPAAPGTPGEKTTGAGRAALTAFDNACKAMARASSAKRKAVTVEKAVGVEVEDLRKAAESAKTAALLKFGDFLDSIETGTEFDEAVKYHNRDTLLSVVTRLENLIATGIFAQTPPPFGDARVRRYNLRPLAQSEDELKMFVRFRLRAIIREAMQLGETDRLRRLIVIDESKRFASESNSNPINVIANEMRKFGIGLLLAGQSPSHFSQDFITNAGTLLVLHLSTTDWADAARKLKIEEDTLKWLKPQSTGAVRLAHKGENPRFRQVAFNEGS